jgi:hypothetical protein
MFKRALDKRRFELRFPFWDCNNFAFACNQLRFSERDSRLLRPTVTSLSSPRFESSCSNTVMTGRHLPTLAHFFDENSFLLHETIRTSKL